MITRMDREVGRVVDLVKELGLEDETIFIFTSDNGPLYDRLGGTDTDSSTVPSACAGGRRTFMKAVSASRASSAGRAAIAAGTTSDRVTGFEDWLPTLLELIGAKDGDAQRLDGISFAPTLLGSKQAAAAFPLSRDAPLCARARRRSETRLAASRQGKFPRNRTKAEGGALRPGQRPLGNDGRRRGPSADRGEVGAGRSPAARQVRTVPLAGFRRRHGRPPADKRKKIGMPT